MRLLSKPRHMHSEKMDTAGELPAANGVVAYIDRHNWSVHSGSAHPGAGSIEGSFHGCGSMPETALCTLPCTTLTPVWALRSDSQELCKTSLCVHSGCNLLVGWHMVSGCTSHGDMPEDPGFGV